MTYRYDPELVSAASAAPVLDVRQPAVVRAALAALAGSAPPFVFPAGVERRSEIVTTRDGSMVEVQIIRRSAAGQELPVVLWFHGGGFVFGDCAMDHPLNARMADELGAVVVSVEYSLAPEHPYPAAVEEGYAVLGWTVANAARLGIDPSRIALAGHSAGGCLAAAVAVMARDRGGPPVCFQALDLPVTDDRLDSPSMRTYTDTPIWDRANAEASWGFYLGGPGGDAGPYAAPLRVAELAGLPPAYVSVAEFDPLRDEGIGYAQRLVQAGVPTELHLFPGTFHGSAAAVPDAAITRSMVGHLLDALGRGLSRTADRSIGSALAEATA